MIGQIRGLDSAPDNALTGIAECSLARGCWSVGRGLANMPSTSPPFSLSWNSQRSVLSVIWLSEIGNVFLGTWSPTQDWHFRTILSVGTPGNFSMSYALDGHVWIYSKNAFSSTSVGPLLCSAPPSTIDLPILVGGSMDLSGCWNVYAPPVLKSFKLVGRPYAAQDSGVLFFVGIDNFVTRLEVFSAAVPDPVNRTFNINSILNPGAQVFASKFHVIYARSSPQTVIVMFVEQRSTSSDFGFFLFHYVEGSGGWKSSKIDPSCDPIFSVSPDGQTVYWLCTNDQSLSRNVSLFSFDLSSENQNLIFTLPSLYSGATVTAMCSVQTKVLIYGNFIGVSVSSGLIPAYNVVLWSLGTEEWRSFPQLGTLFRSSSCRSFNGKIYSVGINDIILYVSRIGADGQFEMWSPALDTEYFSGMNIVSGPAISGDETKVYVAVSQNTATTTASIVSLDLNSFLLNETDQSPSWNVWFSFNQSDSIPFSVVYPIFYGIDMISDESLLVYGQFFVAGNEPGSIQSHLVSIDTKTKTYRPITPMSVSVADRSFVLDVKRGAVFNSNDLLWCGGSFLQVPDVGDVANLAGLSLRNGLWKEGTGRFNAPPSFAIVQKLVASSESNFLVVLSRDSNPSFAWFHSGVNVFTPSGVYPDPSIAEWMSSIMMITDVDLDISSSLSDIVIVVLSTIAIIVVVCIVMFCTWRMGSKRSFRFIEIPDYSSHGVSTNVDAILRDADVIKLSAEEVILGEVIGQGGQGLVRRAVYKGLDVAAKVVLDFSPSVFSSFAKEIKILSSVNHPNIIKFVGVLVKDDHFFLVTELMDTDLSGILSQLDDRMRIQVTVDVISAVAYLHSFEPPVMHRDLKPGNILVSRDGRVKLADFGVSRLMADSSTKEQKMTRDAGTVLYMAPEIWSSDQAYGPSCDIYSYGLVVIELWTGQNPFYPAEFTWILEFLDRVRNKAVVPGVEHMPPSCPSVIVDVVAAAVSFDPAARPTSAVILRKFTSAFSGLAGSGLLPVRAAKHKRGLLSSNRLPSAK